MLDLTSGILKVLVHWLVLKRCVSSKGTLMKIIEKPVLLCPVVQISAAKRCRLASNYLLSEKNKKVPG